jgi:hypothetical protein
MGILSKLWNALGTLTGNVTALAQTVAEINTMLRSRVGLDGADTVPALANGQEGGEAAEAATGNGRRRRGK